MSHELHHFTMGLWVFFLAYATSVVGSYVGLSCVRQSFKDDGKNARMRWLATASLAIGGVGIWLMHFIGMMGFAVPGSTIRYAFAPTLFSVVLAIGATLFGLWIVDSRAEWKARVPRGIPLTVGGLVMGLAVSLMHYSGMAAIRIKGTIEHDQAFVIASIVIGVVASTAALWLAGVAERLPARAAAALIMGCAVVALHYTGMAGVKATIDPSAADPEGLTVLSVLFPAFVLGILVIALPSLRCCSPRIVRTFAVKPRSRSGWTPAIPRTFLFRRPRRTSHLGTSSGRRCVSPSFRSGRYGVALKI